MKTSLKISLLLIFALFGQSASAQTLIVNPHTDGGFEMGNTFAANGWTVVNNTSGGNNWFLTTNTLNAGPYSFAPTDSRVAYISQSANGANWSYDIGTYSTTHIYKTVTFPPGQDVIKLKFRWNAQGEGPRFDVLYVYTCPTTLTPVVGQPFGTAVTPTWTGTGTATVHDTVFTSPVMTGSTSEVTLPATFAGTTRRLVFTWKNGNTLGVQPPAAIDSIWLFADCRKSTISLNNLSVNCSSNINIQSNVANPQTGGTYQWYVNNNPVPGANGANFVSNTVASGSTVKCVYSTNNACNYKDSANVLIQYSLNAQRTETLNICSEALPLIWRNITIPANALSNPAYTTVTVPGPGGCDSLITLNLQVRPSPAPRTEYLSLCRGQLSQHQWRGRSIPNNAQSSPRFDSVRVFNPAGCDSLIYLSLNVIETATVISDTISGCNSIIHNGVRYDTSVVLYDTIRSQSMCDSIVYITRINIEPFFLDLYLLRPQRYLPGEPITLQAQGNSDHFEIISWLPQSLFPSQSSALQFINGPEDQQVQVIAKNEFGCVDTARLNLKAVVLDKDFAMPNAFTPNGDGKNDVFLPVFKMEQDFTIISFEIFNRWGQKVFGSYTGSGPKGWDGYHNGRQAEVGTYQYGIRVRFLDGTEEFRKGDVVLIK